MKQLEYLLKKQAELIHTGIFIETPEQFISCQNQDLANPLYIDPMFREELKHQALRQAVPCIYKDPFQVYFICIRQNENYYYAGPLNAGITNRMELHRYHMQYSIEEEQEQGLQKYSFAEILNITVSLAAMILDQVYEEQLLMEQNQLIETQEEQQKEQMIFHIRQEEAEAYHHTYLEERRLLDCIREGRSLEAVERSRKMDMILGKMSQKEVGHWRNAAIVGITLCTRSAIEGGISPAIAYRLSDFYIQKCDQCTDIAQMMNYRNCAVKELAQRVQERKENRHSTSYVEQSMDYVRKHYREKIYLDDIAEALRISPSYLSRLFKKETGQCLQEYINQVRVEHAANLLIYSEETIARIAEYVNFPSQSYFGRVFKEQKNISPKRFRDTNKPSEFQQLQYKQEKYKNDKIRI